MLGTLCIDKANLAVATPDHIFSSCYFCQVASLQSFSYPKESPFYITGAWKSAYCFCDMACLVDIWSMLKGPWYLVLSQNVHRDIWFMLRGPWSVKRWTAEPWTTHPPGSWWSHTNTAAYLTRYQQNQICITKTVHRGRNTKLIIRSIYTREQLLINFRVTLAKLHNEKEQESMRNPRFLENYKKNNIHAIWMRFNSCIL